MDHTEAPKPCRYCGNPILWTRTKNGRPMPIEPSLKVFQNDEPDIRWVDSDGKLHTGGKQGDVGHEVHFGNCPQYDNQRKS